MDFALIDGESTSLSPFFRFRRKDMASDVEDPQVLRASDTIETEDQSPDGTVVRETRPTTGAVPVDEGDSAVSTPATAAERRVIMHDRYGGMYWGSAFIGFAVASFFTIIFLGIVGAIVGAVGYQLNAPVPKIGSTITNTALTGTSQSLGIGALVGSLIAVFLAYLIGGYTAGRMARFDGARNGFGVWVWTIIVAILLGIAGAIAGTSFNVASQIHLKVDWATLTAAGAISIAVTLVVMLLGAVLGGIMGERYHRPIDRDAEALR
jgi:hypothetical protein